MAEAPRLTPEQHALANGGGNVTNLPEIRVNETPPGAQPAQPGAETGAQPQGPERKPKPLLSEFRRDAPEGQEINLNQETAILMADRLNRRMEVTNLLQDNNKNLTSVETRLMRKGQEVIARLRSGDYTGKDLKFALYVINDELLQKSTATGRILSENPARQARLARLRNIPFLNRLYQPEQGIQTNVRSGDQRFTTNYIDRIGFNGYTDQQIIDELTELNNLRIKFETSLFQNGHQDTLFNLAAVSADITKGLRRSPNMIQDEIAYQLGEVLKQKHEGKTATELRDSDPVAYTTAVFEANQRSLHTMGGESAKDILLKEKPEVNRTAIKDRITQATSIKPEDLTKIVEAADIAHKTFQKAEERYNDVKGSLEPVQSALKSLEKVKVDAKDESDQYEAIQKDRVDRLQDQVDMLTSKLPDIDPSLDPDTKAELTRDLTRSIDTIGKLQERIDNIQDKRYQLKVRQALTERDYVQKQDELKDLLTPFGVSTVEDALTKIKTDTDYDKKKTDLEKAQKDLADKQEEIKKNKVSPENEERAEGLRTWDKILDEGNYDKIIEARFSQSPTGKYKKDRLASTVDRPDGQVDGAERIREHIFAVMDEAKYDPELARKLLSDETIVRAIAHTYNIDMGKEQDSTGNTLQKTLEEIAPFRKALEAHRKAGKGPRDKDYEDTLKEIRDREKRMLQKVLPYIDNGTQGQAGELLKFVIEQGMESSVAGNPYLEIDKYHTEQQPEMRMQAESVSQEHLGQTRFEDHSVIWDGEIAGTRFIGATRDQGLHYRVDQAFDRNRVGYTVQVEVNENFLKALPEKATRGGNMPDSIWFAFYRADGTLRTERRTDDPPITVPELIRIIRERGHISERIGIPQWITLKEEVKTDTSTDTAEQQVIDALNTLAWTTDDRLTNTMAASVTDRILHMSPGERSDNIKGLPDVTIKDVPNPFGGISDLVVNFNNNGEIFVKDLGNNPEINAFFSRITEMYTKGQGVQSLNPDQRTELNKTFFKIQSELGKAILKNQQRR